MKNVMLTVAIIASVLIPTYAWAQNRHPTSDKFSKQYQNTASAYTESLNRLQMARQSYADVTNKQRDVSQAANQQIEYQEAKRLTEQNIETITSYIDLIQIRIEETPFLDKQMQQDLTTECAALNKDYASKLKKISDNAADMTELRAQSAQLTAQWELDQGHLNRIIQEVKLARLTRLSREQGSLLDDTRNAYQRQKKNMSQDQRQEIENRMETLATMISDMNTTRKSTIVSLQANSYDPTTTQEQLGQLMVSAGHIYKSFNMLLTQTRSE